MHRETGEIREMATLSEEEVKSGMFMSVSDELAKAAKMLGLHNAVKGLKEDNDLKRRRRQLEGLRKPGRR